MNRRDAVLVAFVTLFLSAGVVESEPPAVDAADVQAAVEEAKARLKLTPEQETQLKPLIEERTAKLKALHAKHAGDQSRRARREMYREAKPVMEDYQAKVRAILSDEQEAEWEKMRAEARERLKERYREGKPPD